jgi:adenylate cyclase
MLVSTETSALLDAMLSLVEATDADEALPQCGSGWRTGRR